MSYAAALRTAIDAMLAAGALLRAELHRPSGPRGGGSKAPADDEVELQIRSALLAATPYGYLGEESGDPIEGADPSHRWIVDPNDGTAAFLKGRRGASVAIALLRGGAPVLGVVYAYAFPDDEGDLIAWAEGAGPITRNGVAVTPRLGDATLDRRAVVWNQYVTDHKLDVVFSTGKVSESTATDNIPLVDAALKQNPDVQAIFAPYDEITKGVVQAVNQNNLGSKVKVYGIDISNADIEVITADGSPWVATSATDPAAVGAAVVRSLALKLAGQLDEDDVQFPAKTITQSFLTDNSIDNVTSLREKEPSLDLSDQVTADWLPANS